MNKSASSPPIAIPFILAIAAFLFVAAPPSEAQGPRPGEKFMLELPGMQSVRIVENQVYATPADNPLLFDLYTPPGASGKLPLVIFVNGIGDTPDFRMRTHFQYTGWGRLIAASGLAAVNFDVRREHVAEDIDTFLAHLRAHGDEIGIDADNMALWSCSANVREGWALAMSRRPAGVRAAVFYYGNAADTTVRSDLPVQLVKSELDGQGINRGIDAALPRLLRAGTPLDFVVVAGGSHAFDVRDDNEVTRAVMASTVSFLKTWLAPGARERLAQTAAYRNAFRLHDAGDWQGAAAALKSLPGVPHLNGDIGSRLASSYYNLGDFEAAAETYVLTAEIPFARPIMTYNAACSYALIGRKEEAITWLGKCRETGQMNLSAAWNDTDFVSLRDDPRFAEIVGPRP
jgi:hypothetical protein